VEKVRIFKGDVIYTPTPQKFVTFNGGYIVVKNGKVEGVYKEFIKRNYAGQGVVR
jgi:guanine deaminase